MGAQMRKIESRADWYVMGAMCSSGVAGLVLAIAVSNESLKTGAAGIAVAIVGGILLFLAARSRTDGGRHF